MMGPPNNDTAETTAPVLAIRDLSVSFDGGDVAAVAGVDLAVLPGETLAIVGESGSGKSTLARAVLGLLPGTEGRRTHVHGTALFDGNDLIAMTGKERRAVRGARIGFVPQDPMVSLNPVMRIGAQVAEVLHIHRLADRRAARAEVGRRLAAVGLPAGPQVARSYPHELSGGMRQRVLIAMALIARPRLVIADEPTSALDVTVQRRVLDDLAAAVGELGSAVVLITHDLGVAADRAARIAVMESGRIVEIAATEKLLAAPEHPYTRRLLASVPRMDRPLGPAHTRPRSAAAGAICASDRPDGRPGAGAVGGVAARAEHVSKVFPAHGRGPARPAVDDVSFTIPRGGTFALVGESGSGKSTTARMLLGLIAPTGGRMLVGDVDPTTATAAGRRALRRHIQPVFQSPHASFDPRLCLADAIAEPLRAAGVADRDTVVRAVADEVALPAGLLARRPAEVSGGQLQRAAIARALVLRPDIVVCDEPVSALDASLRAQILDLLADLQQQLGLSYLLISHDLAVVRRLADTVGVMRDGKLVETGAADRIFDHPADPYTRELVAAVPGRRLRSTPRTHHRTEPIPH